MRRDTPGLNQRYAYSCDATQSFVEMDLVTVILRLGALAFQDFMLSAKVRTYPCISTVMNPLPNHVP
jgi:hypothetical protein